VATPGESRIFTGSLPRFLLAQLHMDSLAKKKSRREVRKALEKLPKELDDTYEEAMQRIESQDEDDVKLAEGVLSWISFALRPLTIGELQHALAVEPEDTDIDEEALADEDILISVCAGLVTIDQESNIIRLVHYTTQEYFERIRAARFPDAQASIAMTCLVYMSFNVFAESYCENDEEMWIRVHQYPFLRYAAQHWGDHARGDLEEVIEELALKFLRNNTKVISSNQIRTLQGPWFLGYPRNPPGSVTGLHTAAAAQYPLLRYTAQHWGDHARGDLEEVIEEPALKSLRNNTKVMSSDQVRTLQEPWLLLYPERPPGSVTGLHIAAAAGLKKIVQLLLGREGVKPNSEDTDGRAPLSWAVENGQEAVVQLILEHEGVDSNSKDNSGRTPLSWAAVKGHSAVVRLLLERGGVDANTKDGYGWAPLSLAAREGYEAVVRQLLENEGVDANSKDNGGRTPLSLAAMKGHVAVVRRLLEHESVDVNSKDNSGHTALWWAAKRGSDAVVRLLTPLTSDPQ
jgi:ankyrin repeat protein